MVYLENKIVSLNSKFGNQQNGTKLSNVVFPFIGILRKEENIKHVFVSILNAQFPVSFYVINSLNNQLKVMDNSSVTYTINLTTGNYTANTLIQEIILRFSQISFPYLPGIDFNKSNGKYTFIFPQNITILSSQSSIKDILGLGNSNLTGSTITCPYPLNLLGAKLLNITSSALSVSSFSSVSSSNMNILASIPVDAAFFNMVSYVNQSDMQKYELTTDYINSIDLQILDEAGNFIDFNNTNWSVTLGISIERVELQKQNQDLFKSLLSHNMQPEEQIATEDQPQDNQEIQTEEIKETQLLDSFEHPPETQSFMSQLINGATDYTTNVKHIIKQYGDQQIQGITLKRTPISSAIYKALNTASLGKFDQSNPYDKLFHLAMDIKFANGKIIRLEKNATINMTTRPTDKKDTESLEVIGIPQINLNKLLDNAKARMGKKYFSYDSKSNNCQDFILNLFDASRIGNIHDRDFIKQSTRDIFNKSPKYLKGMAKVVTNLGGKFDLVKSELEKHKNDLNFLMR
jgi:RNase P protein component